MSKYRSMLQETFRLYDNPLPENISKLILSYLKFYGYDYLGIASRTNGNQHSLDFLSKDNYASLLIGEDLAILTEYEGHTDAIPLVKTDFIKGERLEYLGELSNRSIVKTIDNFTKSIYFGPKNYIGLRKDDYINNRIAPDAEIEDIRDLSEYGPVMMRIVASADYANEIRAKRFNPPAYYGRQF